MSERLSWKRVRCNAIQKEKLLAFMAKNKDLALGYFLDKNIEIKKWQILQRELAKLGPSKTVEQWKITWRDLKFRAKGSQIPQRYSSCNDETPRSIRRNYYRNTCGPSDEDKLILSIIGNISNSNNNTSEERASMQKSPDPHVPPRYQEIMSMFDESEATDTADGIKIELPEDGIVRISNIKSEQEHHKKDYEGKISAAGDREDPLSNSSPSHTAANNIEGPDPHVPPGYQEIMSMFDESEATDTADGIEIELPEDGIRRISNIESELKHHKKDYEGKISAAGDREDPLSNSSPSHTAANNIEDEVEISQQQERDSVIIEDRHSDHESVKQENIIDHQHYTSTPRERKLKMPMSIDELKRMCLRRKYQNACLERERLLLEMSHAKKKHELEILLLKKQLNKYR